MASRWRSHLRSRRDAGNSQRPPSSTRVAMGPPTAPIVVELPTRELLCVPTDACRRTLAAILRAIAAVYAAAEGRA